MVDQKRTLILLPDRNHIRRDWSGAFLPEALSFAKTHDRDIIDMVSIDVSKAFWKRRWQTLRAIRKTPASQPLSMVAIFCHGWKSGIQLGFRSRRQCRRLAQHIARESYPDVTVALYACSTARDADARIRDDLQPGPGGDGGFADTLRDELVRAGAIHAGVYAHVTKGHATRNPYVRLFADGRFDGGDWLIEPGSDMWRRWRRALRETGLRFRFPMMSVDEIRAELNRGRR